MTTALLIQKVGNGYYIVPQITLEDPMVFVTLKEALNYIATYLGDSDTEFNCFEQQIEIVEKVYSA